MFHGWGFFWVSLWLLLVSSLGFLARVSKKKVGSPLLIFNFTISILISPDAQFSAMDFFTKKSQHDTDAAFVTAEDDGMKAFQVDEKGILEEARKVGFRP